MALQFIEQDGAWNSNTAAVRFFAVDGAASAMFTMSREALEGMEGVESLATEREILAAYRKHIERIREAARRNYAADPWPSHSARRLESADFR